MTRTTCPLGGLYVRRSSHSHQHEDQDILMKGSSSLKEALNDARNLSQLEPEVFLAPFLEIVRSEETTGPVTSRALSAVNEIISYGLVDHEQPIGPCVEAIADAVTHTRFFGTDAPSDGVVLIRILQVLRALVLSSAGDHLSEEIIREIMLSCFRICHETRLSELLRRTAEDCLSDTVQHLFARLSQFADDTRLIPNMKKMRTNGMENSRGKTRKGKSGKQKVPTGDATKQTSDPAENEESEIRLLSPVDRERVDHLATTPVTPTGNIVDMQGSLDQKTSNKRLEDDATKSATSNEAEKTKTNENAGKKRSRLAPKNQTRSINRKRSRSMRTNRKQLATIKRRPKHQKRSRQRIRWKKTEDAKQIDDG